MKRNFHANVNILVRQKYKLFVFSTPKSKSDVFHILWNGCQARIAYYNFQCGIYMMTIQKVLSMEQ